MQQTRVATPTISLSVVDLFPCGPKGSNLRSFVVVSVGEGDGDTGEPASSA